MLKRMLSCTKVAVPLVFGILIGAALSLVILPFLEERQCEQLPREETSDQVLNRGLRTNSHAYLSEGIDFQSFRDVKYEPNLFKSKQNEAISAKRPFRNRFARSEMDIKETLFVGYLGSPGQLSGRVSALNKTLLSPESNSEFLKFFVDASQQPGYRNSQHTSLVMLNPLQSNTLPLLAVKYMANQYYNKYKYYMFVPDSVYVISSTLSDALRGMDDQPYLGFTSSLNSGCDLASGIILSRATLLRISERLEDCEQLFKKTSNGTRALDMCIRLVTSAACKPMGQHLVDYKLEAGDTDLLDDLPTGVHVFSGVSKTNQIYRIRRALAKAEMKDTVSEIGKLREEMTSLFAADKMSWPPAVQPPFETTNRYDIIRWTLVADNTSYLEYDLVNSQPLQAEPDDIITSILNSINSVTKRYQLAKILQTYRRMDPTRGIEYITTLSLYDTVLEKYETRIFEVVKPVTQLQIIPTTSVTAETVPLHIVVPVYEATPGDIEALISNFLLCLNKDSYIHLHLALVYSADEYRQLQLGYKDVFKEVKDYINQFRYKFGQSRMIRLKVLYGDNVSLAEIIMQTVQDLRPNSIIFTSTLTTGLYENVTQRIRSTVQLGQQAYAPIAFWQYQYSLVPSIPTLREAEIARSKGHFGGQWFDHIGFFASDFLDAWKEFKGESYDVYKLLSSVPDYMILRSPDPDCIVRYKEMQCGRHVLDQQKCFAQNLNNVGSSSLLAMKLLQTGAVH